MAEGHIVAGRQFRTKTDYEAALRDKKKIDKICSEYDLKDPKAVLELYGKLKAGDYRFETMVGNDFDDKIYELAEKYKGTKEEDKAGQKKKGRIKGQKNQKKGSAASEGKNAKTTVSLEDLDKDMQREVAAQLKARDRRRKLLVVLCTAGAVLCFGYFAVYYYLAEKTDNDYNQLADLKNSDALADRKSVV